MSLEATVPMSNLTTEQLTQLADRINARIQEFQCTSLPRLSPGVVRIAYEIIAEGWEVPNASAQQEEDGDLLQDAYHFGYQRGTQATPQHERLVTMSAPVAPAETNGNGKPFGYAQDKHAHEPAAPPKTEKKLTSEEVPETSHARSHDEKVTGARLPRTLAEVDAETQTNGASKYYMPTLQELIAEVQRQAMGGVMPTIAAFDMARPGNWATAAAHLTRFNLTWIDLAKEAGLKLTPRQAKVAEAQAAGTSKGTGALVR